MNLQHLNMIDSYFVKFIHRIASFAIFEHDKKADSHLP